MLGKTSFNALGLRALIVARAGGSGLFSSGFSFLLPPHPRLTGPILENFGGDVTPLVHACADIRPLFQRCIR